ncbi:MAG: cation-transporting P-type ATPase, partial [Clostridia bacterium]|nr:cation-transporting P-type ATPase [Clostridia bacterium]
MIWHSSDINDVLNELSVDKDKGLSNGVAEMRLKQYGKNTVNAQKSVSFLKRFISLLNNKITYLLIAISIISCAFALFYSQANFYYPLLIIAIVVLNALFSALQLKHGDTALLAVKETTNPKA